MKGFVATGFVCFHIEVRETDMQTSRQAGRDKRGREGRGGGGEYRQLFSLHPLTRSRLEWEWRGYFVFQFRILVK